MKPIVETYNKKRLSFFAKIFLTLVLTLFVFNTALAAPQLMRLELNTSQYMKVGNKITQIAVANPEIADVVQVPGSLNEFLIIAKQRGSTTIFVWTADKQRYEYQVTTMDEETGQARIIEEAIGLPDVHVKKIDNRILLTGTVRNQYERNLAVQTARLYTGNGSNSSLSVGSGVNMQITTQVSKESTASSTLGGAKIQNEGQVIDLLQMTNPTQIRLEAQVLVINPDDRQSIGIIYGNDPVNAPGVFAIGESYGEGRSGDTFKMNPISWITSRRNNINLSIQALVSKNKAKILSRPSITTMSGEEAIIQVGGKLLYRTYGKSSDDVETKETNYGIILQMKPIADTENRVVSALHAEVSDISGETLNGEPIIDIRRADSVVTVKSGSTMVIGGLMDSKETKNIVKFPLLGDIPIIGEFFKWTSKHKEKQELIILVTPYIVEDGETSRVRMSDEMKQHFDKGREEKFNMNEVDVNN